MQVAKPPPMTHQYVWVLLLGAGSWSLTSCDSDDAEDGGAAAAGGGGAPEPLGGEAGMATAGGGAGGAPGGAGMGGDGGAPECPQNISLAEGQDCSGFAEGFECSDGGNNPCEFGNAIACVDGIWERRESFPAPCGGAAGMAATP
jgi:hypothetical protein